MKTVNHTKNNKSVHSRRSIRLKGYDYSQEGAYFVTICVQDRRCLLSSVKDYSVVLSSIGELVYQCLDRIPVHFDSVELDEFIIMPNHLHALIMIHDHGGVIHELPLRKQRQKYV